MNEHCCQLTDSSNAHTMPCAYHYFVLLFLPFGLVHTVLQTYSAPIQFIEEPENIQFSNKNSGYLNCRAESTLSYKAHNILISWLYQDQTTVKNIADVIIVLPNGTLWFPPFERLIPKIHRGVFRCVATLEVTKRAILSKTATVNGVITKPFQVTVSDQYVMDTGGSALFTCVYPKQMASYVRIIRWWMNDKIVDSQPSGHLVIHYVQKKHSRYLYYCVVHNLLTNETVASNVARLFITKQSISKIPFHISIPPMNKTVFIGETVLLDCLVIHNHVEYSWKHNNKDVQFNRRISLARGSSLKITETSLQDLGYYTCEAKYKHTGEKIHATAYLSVQDSLKFRRKPNKICTSYKSRVMFYCEVYGYPKATITWYKDGEEVKYTKEIVQSGSNLIISSARGQDEGIYQCVANNGMETIHHAASLLVGAYPPKIIKSFEKKILDEHEDLDLSCTVSAADGMPKLLWYRDDQMLSEGHFTKETSLDIKGYLQLKDVTTTDSGLYSCVAINRAGITYQQAEILIKGAAKITYITSKPVGLSGKDVDITCKAKGYPFPKISWFDQDGDSLPNDYRHSVTTTDGESILTIKELNMDDKGEYRCESSNNLGSTVQSISDLEVLSIPEKIELKVAKEGTSVTLTCQGQSWVKDNKRIESFGGITVNDELGVLQIRDIRGKDAGFYHCGETSQTNIYMKSVEIIVITKPHFINEHKRVYEVLEHGTVQLQCFVEGFPTPRVDWRRHVGSGFQPIPKSSRFVTTVSGELTIINATADDQTDYSCIADNNIKNSRTSKLNVKVPARIVNWVSNNFGDAGNLTKLTCDVTGDANMTFTWFHGKKKIIHDNKHIVIYNTQSSSVLNIKLTTRNDAGSYTCEVENDFGSDRRSLVLKIRDKPMPPIITERNSLNRSIKISWKVDFDGYSPITGYEVMSKQSDSPSTWDVVELLSNQTFYMLTSLLPYTSYTMYVKARNSIGLSDPSKKIVIVTLEDVPSAAPTSVKMIPEQQGFTIVWKGIPAEKSNGDILGYHIWYRINGSKVNYDIYTTSKRDGTRTKLTGLKDYTRYEVKLQAYTKAGAGPFSPLVIKRTNEGVPSLPPSNIVRLVLSSTSVLVSWSPPPDYAINGVLVGYSLLCMNVNKCAGFPKNVGLQTNITLKNLIPFTHYGIILAARTGNGLGKTSSIITFNTLEDRPGPPKNLIITVTSVASIKLEWKKPDLPNGNIIAYNIFHYNAKDKKEKELNVSHLEREFVFKNLQENQTYYFWICARTKIGKGNCTNKMMASTSKGPPVFKNGPQSDIFFAEWKTFAVLSCQFTGVPMPTIKWLDPEEQPLNIKNNDKYSETKAGQLIVYNLKRDDTKRYFCSVRNKLGEIRKAVILKVQAPPLPPKNLKFDGINSTAVKMTWTEGDNGNAKITNYSIKYRCVNTDWITVDLHYSFMHFILNDIHTGKLYFFLMSASNAIGQGNFSEPKRMIFHDGPTLLPIEYVDKEEVESKASKLFYKDTAVLGTLIGVCLFIIIVVVVLVLLTKLGFKPGSKIVQRSMETWRWLVAKKGANEDRRRHRRSGGSSTDGHLGGSSSSLSQHASNSGSSFSLPRSSSRVTESGYITSFMPIPFSNYTPGPNGCRDSGSSDEGIGPETRGTQIGLRGSETFNDQPPLPPRSSNGTPAPQTLSMSPGTYGDNIEQGKSTQNIIPGNTKRNDLANKSSSDMENEKRLEAEQNIPRGKEKIYVESVDQYTDCNAPFQIPPHRPKYEDGHYIIGPDVDRILAYRPPRCYDSTSSEYSSSRDELAQAYEFGKLHHLDDYYGRPTLESASSSGETANSEKDGICHFTKELSVGRPFLIPVALLPPPPNQRLRTRDRSRNGQGAQLKTYYEKDETLV